MRTMRVLVQRLGAFLSKKQWERDLAAELQSNLELHTEDNLRAGIESRRSAAGRGAEVNHMRSVQ